MYIYTYIFTQIHIKLIILTEIWFLCRLYDAQEMKLTVCVCVCLYYSLYYYRNLVPVPAV